jgi:hypothetical protein
LFPRLIEKSGLAPERILLELAEAMAREQPAGVNEIVLSLSAKGLTTREIATHFADVFEAKVSKDTIGTAPPRAHDPA